MVMMLIAVILSMVILIACAIQVQNRENELEGRTQIRYDRSRDEFIISKEIKDYQGADY